MLEKLEELKQEKETIENIIKLRRIRHAEQIEEIKADYANKISDKTGTLVLTDEFIKELNEKFENGLEQEFGKQTKIVDLKIEIANKEKEIQEQSKIVADKKKEIEDAENEINHEVIKQYFSKEGLYEQPMDRSHIEALKLELETLQNKLNGLEQEKDELYVKLEALEPSNKKEKTEEGTELEGTKPEGTKTEGTKTEGTEPEEIEPEGIELEGTELEGAEPEGTELEGTEPEGTEFGNPLREIGININKNGSSISITRRI